jgi:hypothetical protein
MKWIEHPSKQFPFLSTVSIVSPQLTHPYKLTRDFTKYARYQQWELDLGKG